MSQEKNDQFDEYNKYNDNNHRNGRKRRNKRTERDERKERNEKLLCELWDQFKKLFPEEEDCLRELYRRVMTASMVNCRYCGAAPESQVFNHRFVRCRNCKKQFWITAGTFFDGMKQAKPWLAAIWLMERGAVLNSSRFHKLLDIAQSSAWYLLKRITMVLVDHMNDECPNVPSSMFCSVFAKRSRETPARQQPGAEQVEVERELLASRRIDGKNSSSSDCGQTVMYGTDESAPDQIDTIDKQHRTATPNSLDAELFSATAHQLHGREKAVFEALTAEPIHFDSLCERTNMTAGELSVTLLNLEFAQLVTCLPGARYSLCAKNPKGVSSLVEESTEALPAAQDFIEMVQDHWDGISRKYLQPYLAAQWFHVDTTRGDKALLDACARAPSITYQDILDYVSPPIVKLKRLPEIIVGDSIVHS